MKPSRIHILVTIFFKQVFKIVKKNGHPSEQKRSEEIEQKYVSGEELSFNDLMNLDSLYKSNYEKFSKKDDSNE